MVDKNKGNDKQNTYNRGEPYNFNCSNTKCTCKEGFKVKNDDYGVNNYNRKHIYITSMTLLINGCLNYINAKVKN